SRGGGLPAAAGGAGGAAPAEALPYPARERDNTGGAWGNLRGGARGAGLTPRRPPPDHRPLPGSFPAGQCGSRPGGNR
ncbi:unnamed protein product, partial [Heterosigma akashiwo]